MPRAPVIPNRHIIFIPFESNLRIMILRHQVKQVRQQEIAFIPCDAVNPPRKAAVDVERFPSCDGVSADHGMDGGQCSAVVERRAADALAERVSESLGLFEEEFRVMGCGEAFEELLHWRGEAVVDLVAGGPERVAAGGGQGVDFEHRVVGRDGLEGDVGVPACAGEAGHVAELVR